MSDDEPQSAPTMLGPGAGPGQPAPAPGGGQAAAPAAPVVAVASAPVALNAGDLPPGTVVGEYRIDRVLGRGGMGTVYAGVQPIIEKRVAIKLLNAQFSADAGLVKRFVD